MNSLRIKRLGQKAVSYTHLDVYKRQAQKLLELGYQSVYDFGGVIDWPYELVKEG